MAIMISSGLCVKVHYRGTFDDGTEFDSSYQHGEPIEFVMGKRAMLPGFEYAVSTLSEGTTCKIHIPAVDAYGSYNEDLVDKVHFESIEHADELPVGQIIQLRGSDGRPVRAKVLKVDGSSVWFDYNHPLAGKDLNFEIELLEVERKTAIEQERLGRPCSCHRVRKSLIGRVRGCSHEAPCEC